jgi:hypothetical protein
VEYATSLGVRCLIRLDLHIELLEVIESLKLENSSLCNVLYRMSRHVSLIRALCLHPCGHTTAVYGDTRSRTFIVRFGSDDSQQ